MEVAATALKHCDQKGHSYIRDLCFGRKKVTRKSVTSGSVTWAVAATSLRLISQALDSRVGDRGFEGWSRQTNGL